MAKSKPSMLTEEDALARGFRARVGGVWPWVQEWTLNCAVKSWNLTPDGKAWVAK